MEKRLTPREAAEWLGVSIITLRNWIKLKKVAFNRVGGKKIVFSEADLRAFLDKGRSEAEPQP